MALRQLPSTVATASFALSIALSGVSNLPQLIGILPDRASPDQKITPDRTIAQEYKPPIMEPPERTEDAGSRGGPCIASDLDRPMLLIPPLDSNQSPMALTVVEYPTFLGYVPPLKSSWETPTSGEIRVFEPQERGKRVIYKNRFPLPREGGIVRIRLPEDGLQPLEVGQQYEWRLIVVCDPIDPSKNAMSESGWIERRGPTLDLIDRLKDATPSTLPAVYAESGMWYDALATLVNLRYSTPEDPAVIASWETLLKSANMEAFIEKPLLECCEIEN